MYVQVLKLYAWEPSFEGQVLTIRDKEVQVLKEQAYLNAGTSFIWSCAPFMVSVTYNQGKLCGALSSFFVNLG